MPKRNGKRLVRDDEPSQKTKTGLEIPIPKSEDFDRLLKKTATKRKSRKRSYKEPPGGARGFQVLPG